jgi:hypothetical protein
MAPEGGVAKSLIGTVMPAGSCVLQHDQMHMSLRGCCILALWHAHHMLAQGVLNCYWHTSQQQSRPVSSGPSLAPLLCVWAHCDGMAALCVNTSVRLLLAVESCPVTATTTRPSTSSSSHGYGTNNTGGFWLSIRMLARDDAA